MPDCRGMVALVTGSSRGIGRAAALELAQSGADVAVTYHAHAEEGEQVAAEIRKLGRRALNVRCNVGLREDIAAAVAATVKDLGGLDIMVSNAASTKRNPFLKLSIDDVEHTWRHTLWANFHCAQLAAQQMVEQGRGGKICMVSSVHADVPMANCMPYATAKAGTHQMAKVIASELASHRINVNVLEPGWIDTPGERANYTEEQLKRYGRALPWGRLGTAEECGKAIAFLCSRDAEYVTGSVLLVDGGFCLPDWRGKAT